MSFALRISVSILAATLVWLVAGSAHAAAPQCDIRGAITFAPNPTLEEPNSSVDIGDTDDCTTKQTKDAYQHGRAPMGIDSIGDTARTFLPATLTILAATPTDKVRFATTTFELAPGARSRVDRPPR